MVFNETKILARGRMCEIRLISFDCSKRLLTCLNELFRSIRRRPPRSPKQNKVRPGDGEGVVSTSFPRASLVVGPGLKTRAYMYARASN